VSAVEPSRRQGVQSPDASGHDQSSSRVGHRIDIAGDRVHPSKPEVHEAVGRRNPGGLTSTPPVSTRRDSPVVGSQQKNVCRQRVRRVVATASTTARANRRGRPMAHRAGPHWSRACAGPVVASMDVSEAAYTPLAPGPVRPIARTSSRRTSRPPRRRASRVSGRDRAGAHVEDPEACHSRSTLSATRRRHHEGSPASSRMCRSRGASWSAPSPATQSRIRSRRGTMSDIRSFRGSRERGHLVERANVQHEEFERPVCVRSDWNVSRVPSGDHRGCVSSFGPS